MEPISPRLHKNMILRKPVLQGNQGGYGFLVRQWKISICRRVTRTSQTPIGSGEERGSYGIMGESMEQRRWNHELSSGRPGYRDGQNDCFSAQELQDSEKAQPEQVGKSLRDQSVRNQEVGKRTKFQLFCGCADQNHELSGDGKAGSSQILEFVNGNTDCRGTRETVHPIREIKDWIRCMKNRKNTMQHILNLV